MPAALVFFCRRRNLFLAHFFSWEALMTLFPSLLPPEKCSPFSANRKCLSLGVFLGRACPFFFCRCSRYDRPVRRLWSSFYGAPLPALFQKNRRWSASKVIITPPPPTRRFFFRRRCQTRECALFFLFCPSPVPLQFPPGRCCASPFFSPFARGESPLRLLPRIGRFLSPI